MRTTTIDPEARYLDHERIISELEEAERDHELNAAGVIERLKEAHDTCQAAADRYTVKATEAWHAGDAYVIARGKYLAEIKRRVELPSGNGSRLKTPDRPGWKNWCARNKIAPTHAICCIEASKGNVEKIHTRRKRNLESLRKHLQRKKEEKVLPKIQKLWELLSPAEREEFIRWALSQKNYGPPPIKEARRASEFEAHA